MTLDELKVAVDRAADPRQPLGWPEVKALRTLSRMLKEAQEINNNQFNPWGGQKRRGWFLPRIEEGE